MTFRFSWTANPPPSRPRLRRRLFALLGAFGLAAVAGAKELHWREIAVRARLDDAGTIHVVERQTMVFTGDWNGGERIFRVEPGQSFSLDSVSRVAEDGSRVPLQSGNLDQVDHYDLIDSKTLRWRSRLPNDPPFDDTERVYEISYRLSGILVRSGDRYALDHDFLFPDRAGTVERFSLALALDPSWKAEPPLRETYTASNLRPGEGFLVRSSLAFVGSGKPPAGPITVSPRVRGALFFALLVAALALFAAWWRRDSALGRFAPLPSAAAIDSDWLEKNLLSLAPEEAGALWDEKIGPPEVSAILARLAAAKKIETRAEGKKLVLKRLIPVAQFSAYDQELIKGLFFGHADETDTDKIRAHYRSSGFDPASLIRPFLKPKLDALPDFGDRAKKPAAWPGPALFLLGVATLVATAASGRLDPGNAVGTGIGHLVLWGAASASAAVYQKRVERHLAFSWVFLWAPLLILAYAWTGYRDPSVAVPGRTAAVFLMRLAILFTVFQLVATRSGAKRLARRKALVAARKYFRRELQSATPRLSDAWFPYVVAFGLTSDADRWSREHATGAASSGTWSGSSGSASGSSSGSSGSWSGGGGAFGGAGASGSWAVAAGALSAGVASPSSSGGGGGGGGGGSSGGGGGGGW